MAEWIKCSERMPPEGRAVLAFWEPLGGNSVCNRCYAIAKYERGSWRAPEDDEDEYADASCWQPLLPPQREGGGHV